MLVKYRSLWIVFCAFLFPLGATADCLNNAKLTGINQAGAEFNSAKLPGIIDKDYTYPVPSDLVYIASQGANVIRLPFRWERLQPTVNSPLNPAELLKLQATVEAARVAGLCVILDVHNYAKYFGKVMAGDAALQSAFVDLWTRIDAAFPDPHSTIFDLMNEPNYMSITEWSALAKRTLAKLRQRNSTHIILIAGGRWSGAHDWFAPQTDGQSNANAFKDVADPLKRTIIQVHQYVDLYYSGTTSVCQAPEIFTPIFTRITNWAKENNQTLFLGEFGVATTPECLLTLNHVLTQVQDPVWRGWTYWAGGRWWSNYAFWVNTTATVAETPQWTPLKKNFYVATAAIKAYAPKPPKPLNSLK